MDITKKINWKSLLATVGVGISSPLLLALIIYLLGWYKTSAVQEVKDNYTKKEIYTMMKYQQECIDENAEEIFIIKKIMEERFGDEEVKFDRMKLYMDREFKDVKKYINEENKELRNLIINILKNGTSEKIQTKSSGSWQGGYCEGWGNGFSPEDEVKNAQGMENYWRNMYDCGWSVPGSVGTYPPWMDNLCNNRPAHFVKWSGNMGWLSDR